MAAATSESVSFGLGVSMIFPRLSIRSIGVSRISFLLFSIVICFLDGFLMEQVSMANQQNQQAEEFSKVRALEIARKTIENLNSKNPLVIMEDKTLEKDFGWVFFYTTKKYLETHDKKYLMPGNSPLVVDRVDGTTHFLSTSLPPIRAIEEYEKNWRSRHKHPS